MMTVVEVVDASNIKKPIGKGEVLMKNIKNTTPSNGEVALYKGDISRNVVCWAIVQSLETATGDVEKVDRVVGMVIDRDNIVPATSLDGFKEYREEKQDEADDENVDTRDLLYGNQ